MQKGKTWAICLLALGTLAVGTPLRAQAENEGTPMYIYVAQWAVPRANWAEVQGINDADRTLMDKLVADGTITSYGEFMNLIHVEGQPTHGDWFTATSEGNILKALEALSARPGTTAPALAASKHWDYFLVSRMHNHRAGNFDGAYLAGIAWDLKPGQVDAFRNLLKSRIVPILEKLLADGALVFYNVAIEDYHTAPPGHIEIVFTTPDASGVDTATQAFEAALAKDTEIGPAMESLVKSETHRDFLFRVSHMSIK